MNERRRMTDNDHDRVVILEGQMTDMRAAVATMTAIMEKLNEQVSEIARDTKEIREIGRAHV